MSAADLRPFDRFSEDAKQALNLAQEAAEKAGDTYIGTEHLLLGILLHGHNPASRALHEMGVTLESVRNALARVTGRPEPKPEGGLQPTLRAKRVIELAFQQSEGLGHGYLGCEHLLLGLLVEAEGIAGRVLRDLGVTMERTWAEISLLLPEAGAVLPAHPFAGRPLSPPLEFSAEAMGALREARHLAEAEGTPTVGLDHLRRVLAERS
jgi:ATP-dependent Clp protease ATP-binding subunit ClpC